MIAAFWPILFIFSRLTLSERIPLAYMIFNAVYFFLNHEMLLRAK